MCFWEKKRLTLLFYLLNWRRNKRNLIELLKKHRSAFGWNDANLKGISPSICTHRIYLEEDAKPIRQMQRRLNPNMQEVVKKEVLKLLDVGIIYPISYSQ